MRAEEEASKRADREGADVEPDNAAASEAATVAVKQKDDAYDAQYQTAPSSGETATEEDAAVKTPEEAAVDSPQDAAVQSPEEAAVE